MDLEDLEPERPELPEDAGSDAKDGFEPNDAWLALAPTELRCEAMRLWFVSRYSDPVHTCPYNGQEGGYLYIHGGPYTADDELYRRFGKLSDDEEIAQVVVDVESSGIEEWAPSRYEPEDDYDAEYALYLTQKSQPLETLKRRLSQLQQLLILQGSAEAMALQRNLVFGAVIGALEAYLYEVAYYWIDTDETALRDLLEGLPHFKQENMSMADIFHRHANIKNHVKGYFQSVVWHRLEAVAAIYKHALGVALPNTKAFAAAILKRHDIVHRSGHTKDGTAVSITDDEIKGLSDSVQRFAEKLEELIADRDVDIAAPEEF